MEIFCQYRSHQYVISNFSIYRWTVSTNTNSPNIYMGRVGVTIDCTGPYRATPDPHQTAPGRKWPIISLRRRIKRRKTS